jgi:hypothetical protein
MPFVLDIPCLVPFVFTSAKFGAKRRMVTWRGKKMYEKKKNGNRKRRRRKEREPCTSGTWQEVRESAQSAE